jgi:hypothetical protein
MMRDEERAEDTIGIEIEIEILGIGMQMIIRWVTLVQEQSYASYQEIIVKS